MSNFIFSAFAISSWRFQIFQLGDLSVHFVLHNRVVTYYRYDRVYKSGLSQLEGFVYSLFSLKLAITFVALGIISSAFLLFFLCDLYWFTITFILTFNLY